MTLKVRRSPRNLVTCNTLSSSNYKDCHTLINILCNIPAIIPSLVMYNVDMICGCGPSDVICELVYPVFINKNVMLDADGHGQRYGG
jgi:hypothetical protein